MSKFFLALFCCIQLTFATDPRLLDRLWQQYIPTVNEFLVGHLVLDEALTAEVRQQGHVQLTMRLWLDARGAVSRVVLETPSPLRRFDRACQTAAEQIGVLPDLSPPLRTLGQREGLLVTFGR